MEPTPSAGPRDILEATETVHWFLRLLFLNRVKSKKSGGYTLVNRFQPALVFGIIYVATDLYFLVFQRIKLFNEMPTVLMVEVLSSICSMSDFIVILYKANCQDDNKVRKEFDDLTALDKELDIKHSTIYKRDRYTVNINFFVILFVRIAVLTCCVIGYIYTFAVNELLAFAPQWWSQVLQTSNYAYNISKLKLMNYRMLEMKKQIGQLCRGEDPAEGTIKKLIPNYKMKTCYMDFYEICRIFNESQGLQILLAYARLILNAISIIGFTSKQELSHVSGVAAGLFTLLLIDIAFMVLLLFYCTTLLQTSDEISVTVEKALVNKYFDCERERAAWEEFVELTHRCPLVLTAYDFFPLDYSLIGATFGTMVTYTIIITQLNP